MKYCLIESYRVELFITYFIQEVTHVTEWIIAQVIFITTPSLQF